MPNKTGSKSGAKGGKNGKKSSTTRFPTYSPRAARSSSNRPTGGMSGVTIINGKMW